MTDDKRSTFSERLASFCIRSRVWLLVAILAVTVVLFYFAYKIPVETRFQDLLPEHQYMNVHNQFKENFGGENVVSILIELEKEGTIFQRDVLQKIQTITRDLRKVEGVNPGTIMSLASKRIQQVTATAYEIKAEPLMWPEIPKTQKAIMTLKQDVQGNPQVYGVYVSRDLKAALVTVDFYTNRLNPVTAFRQIRDLNNRVEDGTVSITAVGNPILYGWVDHFFQETLTIMIVSLIIVGLSLLLFTQTLWGMFVPLLGTLISGVWALGIAQLLDLHFDPLVIVIAFLIMARVISASVQSFRQFQREMASGEHPSSVDAAVKTLGDKWTPGALAVVTDAAAFLIVYLTPIPILQKIAFIGFIWLITIPVTSIIFTSLCLSFAENFQDHYILPFSIDSLLNPVSEFFQYLSETRLRWVSLGAAALLLIIAGYYATGLTIGDARPGSPILWPGSVYNQTVGKINSKFLGSNHMFVAITGNSQGALKEPSILHTMKDFQRVMEAPPEIGGTLSLADLLPAVNRTLNEGDPRYQQLGSSAIMNGELLFFFVDNPESLTGLSDARLKNGAVNLYFRDHKGKTIEEAFKRIRTFVEKNPMQKANYELAGGKIGVIAATNAVIEETELQSIALALLFALIVCALTYNSALAGLYLIVPLVVANAVTYGYMAWADIGLNINSVPVAALGIGLGIDYAIYVADRMRRAYRQTGRMSEALRQSLHGAGQSVIVTVIVLAVSIVPFLFSSLRFQAEMALLIALWMIIAAFGAVIVIPALVAVFRPQFVVGDEPAAEPEQKEALETVKQKQ